jgi:hypothetical protein
MPRDNGNAAPIGPCGQFAGGMSEVEVQQIKCFNALMDHLKQLNDAKLPPEENRWRREAIEIDAVRSTIERLETMCHIANDPSGAEIIRIRFRPLLGRLMDDLARKRSIRPDGVSKKPTEYVLTGSIWKADCAAAADVLICSRPRMSHGRVKEWLRPALVRHGLSDHTNAERVIDWRDEIVERLPAFRRLDKTVGHKDPLDLMAEIFNQRRPIGPDKERERLSQAEADRRADEWLRDARLNIPQIPTIPP